MCAAPAMPRPALPAVCRPAAACRGSGTGRADHSWDLRELLLIQGHLCFGTAQKCYVFMNDGQIFLVGEGYPVESSVSSVGPQSVVGRIKNEIKAGNPVTWSWRGAGAFKKFAPKKEVLVDKSEGNLSAEQAKRAKAKGEKEDNGGLFGFLSPPKKLSSGKKVAATEDSEDEE